jgi:hypothetical protein
VLLTHQIHGPTFYFLAALQLLAFILGQLIELTSTLTVCLHEFLMDLKWEDIL